MLRCRDLPGDPKHDPKRTARPLTASKPRLRKASGPNGGVRNDPSGLVGAGEMVLLSLTLFERKGPQHERRRLDPSPVLAHAPRHAEERAKTMAREELQRLLVDAWAGWLRGSRLYLCRLDRLTRTGIADTLEARTANCDEHRLPHGAHEQQ